METLPKRRVPEMEILSKRRVPEMETCSHLSLESRVKETSTSFRTKHPVKVILSRYLLKQQEMEILTSYPHQVPEMETLL
jgi:hypothetical protein